MFKTILVSALTAIVVVGLIMFFNQGTPKTFGIAAPSGSTSFFTAIGSQYGYYIGSYGSTTQIIDETGGFVANTFFKAGQVASYTNSTSTTATTQTLSASDIANYTAVIMRPNVGAPTFTLPASSTLTAFIPNAGDTVNQCWYNATSSTVANGLITFAAGTGIDLEVASSTNGAAGGITPNLTIRPGNTGCFRFIRKPADSTSFDIVAEFTAYVDGD